ncbi:6-phospho-beta-glucosidase, partial [Streptococcus suis]
MPYLAENCVVEVTSIISAQGETPLACPPTPPIVTGYLQLIKHMEL